MTSYGENQYLDIMRRLIADGNYRDGRNGATYSLFGEQMRFDLKAGFPLLTTKRVPFHLIVSELIWMLRGDTNIRFLHEHNNHIWDEWADEHGNLGPVYGAQWRNWNGYETQSFRIDQIENLIEGIKGDPYGRRHIVTAWNPEQLNDMKLPPCHCFFQCHVADGKLNLHLYQRSADWFLGVPFNIASYALLTHLIARECALEPGTFVHSFGDLHLYANHLDAAKEQLSRSTYPLCDLELPPHSEETSIFKIEPKDISVANYNAHGRIAADVSV